MLNLPFKSFFFLNFAPKNLNFHHNIFIWFNLPNFWSNKPICILQKGPKNSFLKYTKPQYFYHILTWQNWIFNMKMNLRKKPHCLLKHCKRLHYLFRLNGKNWYCKWINKSMHFLCLMLSYNNITKVFDFIQCICYI